MVVPQAGLVRALTSCTQVGGAEGWGGVQGLNERFVLVASKGRLAAVEVHCDIVVEERVNISISTFTPKHPQCSTQHFLHCFGECS